MTAERAARMLKVGFPLPEPVLLDLGSKPCDKRECARSRSPSPLRVDFAETRDGEPLAFRTPLPISHESEPRPVEVSNRGLPNADGEKYWRPYTADTSSPCDVIKKSHLLPDEEMSLSAATTKMKRGVKRVWAASGCNPEDSERDSPPMGT